jgi:lipid-A-disaccharide synthase
MKYYIIAGEASGDLHGSNLIREIKKLDNAAEIRAWGGDKMRIAGATLAKHYKDLAFMGFLEVVKNLPTIMQNLKFCKKDIENFRPDVVVLINYSAFNLRIAKWTHQHEFKNIFYISPQVWAWKESRVKTIKRFVDKMIVILPFEKEFFKKWDYEVDYVGHPLVDVIEKFEKENRTIRRSQKVVALLPGSRRQEIKTKLPIMLAASKSFPDYNFIVAKAPSIEDEFYTSFLEGYYNVEVVADSTYALLMKANAALVTSGTATLETALFGVPEIICYKAGRISYEIARRLVKLKYICLVNLIMDKEVVKELIQNDLTPENITRELKGILLDTLKRERIEKDYAALKNLLSLGGNASANAAGIIYEFTKKSDSS